MTTLAWIYPDEANSKNRALLALVSAAGAWVPSLWRLEVANVLESGVRRGRLSGDLRDSALADLAFLPIQLDPDTDLHAWGSTAQLAKRHGLTVYDACYLELAIRRRLPLATLDKKLRIATDLESAPTLGGVEELTLHSPN